jgi:hypothetical protein
MDRVKVRTEAQELLDQVYMTAAESGQDSRLARLTELAREVRSAGAPLSDHREGPWRSDRCRFAHTAGAPSRQGDAEALTCLMRGEFALPLPEAAEVAALLNWAEVPEPGAQT